MNHHFRALTKLTGEINMAQHRQECHDDACPLTVGEELLTVLDRRSLTNSKLIDVISAVLIEYQMRLASPAQQKELSDLTHGLARKLSHLADLEQTISITSAMNELLRSSISQPTINKE